MLAQRNTAYSGSDAQYIGVGDEAFLRQPWTVMGWQGIHASFVNELKCFKMGCMSGIKQQGF
jgi:hypothetical protein